MNTRFQRENLFENAPEQVLIGTPEMIVPQIRDIIKRMKSEGYPSTIQVKAGDAPDFSPARQVTSYRCEIFGKSAEVGEEIGYIELQPLPGERTLFKLMYLPSYNSFFTHFVQLLFAEFQRLGFVYFEKEKPPLGFRPKQKEQT